jgi:hypothetical protein
MNKRLYCQALDKAFLEEAKRIETKGKREDGARSGSEGLEDSERSGSAGLGN